MPKIDGSAIMVSELIDEVGGFLEIGDMKARTTLEHQKDGYFTNDQFVDQVDKAMGILKQSIQVHKDCFCLIMFHHIGSLQVDEYGANRQY